MSGPYQLLIAVGAIGLFYLLITLWSDGKLHVESKPKTRFGSAFHGALASLNTGFDHALGPRKPDDPS